MTNRPANRTRFNGAADELAYLGDKVAYWLYERDSPARARRFCPRLAQLLKGRNDDGSIVFPEYHALLNEAHGRIDRAIPHRLKESQRIAKLLRVGGPVAHIDHEYFVETLIHLACLQIQAGQSGQARLNLRKAKDWARRYGVAFSAEPLLAQVQSTHVNGKNRSHRDFSPAQTS